jgi:DNA repair protein RecO (recombination protein O)
MPPIATDAFVLRTYTLGESSKVVVLLTRERGKARAVAKGARGSPGRYLSALEPLSEVRVSLHGRQGAELYRLGQCELVRSAFPTGSRGLETALALSYFAELLESFSQEGEAEDPVYRLAAAVLAAAATGDSVVTLARYLEAWLLRLHGIYPPIDRCAGCGGALPAGPLAYHAHARGFVCDRCGPASGPLLVDPARRFLAEVFHRAPAALEAAPAEATILESFHRDLITQHLERGLRSHRVLSDVARDIAR